MRYGRGMKAGIVPVLLLLTGLMTAQDPPVEEHRQCNPYDMRLDPRLPGDCKPGDFIGEFQIVQRPRGIMNLYERCLMIAVFDLPRAEGKLRSGGARPRFDVKERDRQFARLVDCRTALIASRRVWEYNVKLRTGGIP